jgi:hypothetical protein
MATPIHITTHVQDAAARLLTQYQGKPLITGKLAAFNAQTQAIEDALFGMIDARSVFDAVGVQLDGLGVIVGVTRLPGLSDDIYRRIVLAKAVVNASQCDEESIGLMYRQMLLATASFFQDLYPAAFMIMANGSIDSTLIDTAQTFLFDVAVAGVSVDHFGYYDPTNPFELGDVNVPASLSGPDGLGDVNTPSIGGLIGALYVP